MKKPFMFYWFWVLILFSDILLGMSSCDIESIKNQDLLIGTWEDSWIDNDGDTNKQRLTFTKDGKYSDVSEVYVLKNENYNIKKEFEIITTNGTYIADEKIITYFFINSITGEEISSKENYIVTKDTLTLKRGDLTLTFSRID